MKQKNEVLELSFQFALDIIKYTASLEKSKKYIIANQLIKSGTSIGANISEAQSAESRTDFIHKLKIASKEAAETAYWLKLCSLQPDYPQNTNLEDSLASIQRLLTKIIVSSKNQENR
ncbi:MAG: four helix bundle protein [Bacteroidales bacterium]